MQEEWKTIKVWCDGACFPNPGVGGWAWTTLVGEEDSGGHPRTTNQRMELLAVLNAVKHLHRKKTRVVVFTDSQYVINGATIWTQRWIENQWVTKTHQKVKYREEWEELYKHTRTGNIAFQWVRGHSGDPGNERADYLASQATGCPQDVIQGFRKKWHHATG